MKSLVLIIMALVVLAPSLDAYAQLGKGDSPFERNFGISTNQNIHFFWPFASSQKITQRCNQRSDFSRIARMAIAEFHSLYSVFFLQEIAFNEITAVAFAESFGWNIA